MNDNSPLPDSGERSKFPTGAVRDASIGKGHFHSIPPIAMRKLAKRFEDGARKYSGAKSVSIEDSLNLLDCVCSCENTIKRHCAIQTAVMRQKVCACNAISKNTLKQKPLPVIQTVLTSTMDSAECATTVFSKSETQSTPQDNGIIPIHGLPPTHNVLTRTVKPTTDEIHLQEPDSLETPPSQNSILPPMTRPLSWLPKEGDAAFAADHQDVQTSTSTTTTKQEKSEDCSAEGVTKDSDYLEMILSLSKEHSPSCAIHRRLKFYLVNERLTLLDRKPNWQLGIPLSHYEDSLTRHILAWKEGDESEDHAGAIIWNACTMVWTDEEIKAGRLPVELDDLPYCRKEQKTSTP